MSENVIIFLIFLLYAAVMVGIGLFYMKKNKNVDDYFLGGRTLNPWVAAMSASASDMSGWLLTGLPGLAFLSVAGAKEAFWTAAGLLIGTYLNWLFVAKRLRAYTEVSKNSLTLPEFFENRFRDKKGLLKVICALFILIFFTVYTASMFNASAKLFTNIFGLNYHVALLIGVVVILAYTVLGGFLAVSMTDLIQGILMFIALLIVPVIAIFHDPAVDPAAGLQAVKEGFTNIFPQNGDISVVLIFSALAWGLGYFGQPHILVRFMGIKKASYVRPARIISIVWVVLTMAGALSVGFVGKLYFAGGLEDSETVFMSMVNGLFPVVIAGVFLSAILAAIMSTADSQLLVAASSFSNDILKKIKKNITEKQKIWASRLTVAVLSLIAALLAMNPQSSVFSIVSFAWGGFGGAFGPAILFSLFWKRTNLPGIYAGILSGGLGSILFYFLKVHVGGIFSVYEILPAFILSSILIVVVSLATAKPSEEICEEFDRAKAAASKKNG